MKKLERRRVSEVIRNVHAQPRVCGEWRHKPVPAEAHHAAVVLIASLLIQHAGVDDVTNRDIQIVGT